MATFVTDAVLQQHAAAANSLRAAPLPDHWDRILPQANLRAYQKLRAVMIDRGLSPAQFAAWGAGAASDGYDWNLRLGVVYAFLEASKADEDRGAAYRAELLELLEELRDLPIVIDGDAAVIDRPRVSTGDEDTSRDRFRLSTPDGSGNFNRDGTGFGAGGEDTRL